MAGWLAACSTANKTAQTEGSDPNHPFAHQTADAAPSARVETQALAPAGAQAAAAPNADPTTTGTVLAPLGVPAAAEKGQLGADPYDELSLGKREYHADNYGLAEKHFRRAVELHPNDAEAWLGLAACYDRLRRFDLADRAYKEAIRLRGPTVEILNNQGFSYMLRGDYPRARAKLIEAEHRDPDNKFVKNNLKLLEDSWHKRKAVAH